MGGGEGNLLIQITEQRRILQGFEKRGRDIQIDFRPVRRNNDEGWVLSFSPFFFYLYSSAIFVGGGLVMEKERADVARLNPAFESRIAKSNPRIRESQISKSVTVESKLDPGFAKFFHWCKDNDVPVVIVSRYGSAISPYSIFRCRGARHIAHRTTADQCCAVDRRSLLSPRRAACSGMEPLIRAVLSKLIGEEDAAQIDVISNGVKVEPDGAWEIQFRHPER